MCRLTLDGIAETVSRDQTLRHERGQGSINFPCSADHEQDWQPYPVDPYSCYMCDYIYIYIYIYIMHELESSELVKGCIHPAIITAIEVKAGEPKTENVASIVIDGDALTRWAVIVCSTWMGLSFDVGEGGTPLVDGVARPLFSRTTGELHFVAWATKDKKRYLGQGGGGGGGVLFSKTLSFPSFHGREKDWF